MCIHSTDRADKQLPTIPNQVEFVPTPELSIYRDCHWCGHPIKYATPETSDYAPFLRHNSSSTSMQNCIDQGMSWPPQQNQYTIAVGERRYSLADENSAE